MMISEDEIAIHLQRLTRVGDWCAERNACFIALDSFTIRWLTGFTGSNGVMYLDQIAKCFLPTQDMRNKHRLKSQDMA